MMLREAACYRLGCVAAAEQEEAAITMSILLMSQAWKESPFEGTALLIELSLADFANDEGVCWPSIATLAQKARCSETWVHRIIGTMKKMGRLTVETGGGRGRPNVYRLNLMSSLNPAFNAPFSATKRVHSATKRVHSVAERVNRSAPDPSLDPSLREPPPLRENVVVPVVRAFERSFGRLLSPTEIESIRHLDGEHPRDRIDYALREAAELNKRSVRYVQSICENQSTNGDNHDRRRNNPKAVGAATESTPQVGGFTPRELVLDP